MKRIVACLFILASCKTIPLYKKTYTVHPKKNKVCRIKFNRKGRRIEKKLDCYSLNAKDKDGKYMFEKFDGYIMLSFKALRETLLKTIDGLK